MTAPPYRSLADYKMAYYKGKLGLSVTANWSLSDLEYAYFYDQVVNGGANTGGGGGGGGTGVDLSTATGFLSADKVIDGTTNKVYPATDKTKLAGITAGATANSTDATLRDRSTHTGTQSADTVTNGTNNKVYTTAEQTKLTGVATGATANSTDATLLSRANHTGSQTASTISDFTEAGQDLVGNFLQDGTGFDVTYNDAGNAITIAATGSEGYKIFWNATTKVWGSARPTPDGLHYYQFISENDATATQPPDMIIGDSWDRHPDALALP